MSSTFCMRGVVENDETVMSLFPSLYDDDVEFYFAEQSGEKTPTDVDDVVTDTHAMNKLMFFDDDVLSLTACGFGWLRDNSLATPDILDMVVDLSAAEESVDLKTFIRRPPVDVRSSDDAGETQCAKRGRKACQRSSEKHKQLVLDVQQVKSSDAARQAQYEDRRRKNNESCKRTRAKRKQETTHMQQEIVSLRQVNARLQRRVKELERKLDREQ